MNLLRMVIGMALVLAALVGMAVVPSAAQARECRALLGENGVVVEYGSQSAFQMTSATGLSCSAANNVSRKAIRYYRDACQMGTCASQRKFLKPYRCKATKDGAEVVYTCKAESPKRRVVFQTSTVD